MQATAQPFQDGCHGNTGASDQRARKSARAYFGRFKDLDKMGKPPLKVGS
jgi:hypothetical protein